MSPPTNSVVTGDTFDVLPDFSENSVHACVTDPPYGLNFMSSVTNGWDDFEPKEYQSWCERWATECLRVLKPGGHLLAFSGNRTHHRLMSGVEDAGYEIRDCITYHYGSGFPKALDVSKAIDKQADADREVVGEKEYAGGHVQRSNAPRFNGRTHNNGQEYKEDKKRPETEPATEQAEQWDGFKSALKPATEFVCVARSPLAEDTIAENVVAHGTGALNIDATRIESDGSHKRQHQPNNNDRNLYIDGFRGEFQPANAEGRYPSNVVFDAQQAAVLDEKVGNSSEGGNGNTEPAAWGNVYGGYDEGHETPSYEDSGGPSRYFYTSKASKAERTLDGKIDNAHPTVKPIDLMEWLVQLATAEEQIVLDPFAGSGTTCKAAKNKHRQFIGIEQQPKWADVARVRSGLPPDDHTHIRSDDAQQGFEAYQ